MPALTLLPFNLILVSTFLSFISFSQTYSTLSDGAWNNTTTVWSTDGFTPCSCTPGATLTGVNVIINHNITMTANLTVDGGSTFNINPTGTLTGGNNINVSNATMDFFGNASFNRFVLGTGADVDVHSGVIINLNNQLQVTGGVLTINAGRIYAGSTTISNGASLIMTNGGRLDVVTGNFTNHGLVNIGNASCLSTNGNWRNMATGVVTGVGAVNSGGNLQNNGTWDVNVSWCSNGAGLGMPTPEDCTTAQGICNAIVLPVELTYFSANAIENSYVVVDWETSSEANSDYFLVQRSLNGKDWINIGSIDAAGNSSEAIRYSFDDFDPSVGDNYYRLVQVDINGTMKNSEIIMATLHAELTELSVYPNPSSSSGTFTIRGVQFGDELQIRNSMGGIVNQQWVSTDAGVIHIDASFMQPGVYLVSIPNAPEKPLTKLVITR